LEASCRKCGLLDRQDPDPYFQENEFEGELGKLVRELNHE